MLRSGEPTLILLTGRALRADGLELAGRIAARTGARLIAQGSNARTQRGRGRVSVERIPYVVDQALKVLAGLKHVILVGSKMPVAFFAYPDKPSLLTPPDCQGHVLARPEEDLIAALDMLAEAVGARGTPAPIVNDPKPAVATGAITSEALGRLDRGADAGERDRRRRGGDDRPRLFRADQGSQRRMTGCRTWAARSGSGRRWRPARRWPAPTARSSRCRPMAARCIRCRRLWTQAREQLDVTTVLFSNRTYQILRGELANVGAGNPGRKALDMLDIGNPDIDWVGLAKSVGVPGARVDRHGRVQPPLCRRGRNTGAVPGRGRALIFGRRPGLLWRPRAAICAVSRNDCTPPRVSGEVVTEYSGV